MRRMYSKNQLENIAVNGIAGQDIAPANIAATGSITGDEIIENMSGYLFAPASDSSPIERDFIYCGVCKNGNKITFVVFVNVTPSSSVASGTYLKMGEFKIPAAIDSLLFPVTIGNIEALASQRTVLTYQYANQVISAIALVRKSSENYISFGFYPEASMAANQLYTARLEFTFLLSDNLAPVVP